MTNLTKAQIKIYNNDIKINRDREMAMAMAYRESEGGRKGAGSTEKRSCPERNEGYGKDTGSIYGSLLDGSDELTA
jgi:hypothetical protein